MNALTLWSADTADITDRHVRVLVALRTARALAALTFLVLDRAERRHRGAQC